MYCLSYLVIYMESQVAFVEIRSSTSNFNADDAHPRFTVEYLKEMHNFMGQYCSFVHVWL